ncbi:hypothetical protein FB645_004872 [Coemansia sp. IMI 203386]|nr:hypothetical protein FB645_004872 [Coemansia sp. IMI 203386]
MARTVIYLARHGETDANASGIMQGKLVNMSLNERGRHQAAYLAREMSNKQLDWIVSSKMDRAVETADIVAQLCPGVPVSREERLHEISFGIVDGKKYKSCKHLVQQVSDGWKAGNLEAKVTEGESANEAKARLQAVFADILAEACKKKYRNVFICTHGGVLRLLMALLVNKDMRTSYTFPHRNCSYHRVAVELNDDDNRWSADPFSLGFEALDICKIDHLSGIADLK